MGIREGWVRDGGRKRKEMGGRDGGTQGGEMGGVKGFTHLSRRCLRKRREFRTKEASERRTKLPNFIGIIIHNHS